MKELTPDLDGFLAQVAQAASSIQSAGQANVDGQSVPGPQAMTHLLDRWRLLHAGVQRYHGVLLASQLASMATLYGGSAVMPAVPTATGAPSHENPLLTRYATKFNAEMVAALVKLIEADTVRAPAAEVPELYASYLSAAAPVVPRVSDVGLASSLQAALRKLAAKAPEFAANYDNGTDNEDAISSLKKLLEYLNINPSLALSIADWIDPDSEPRLYNSENAAKNDFLWSVDELKLIEGIDRNICDKISPFMRLSLNSIS